MATKDQRINSLQSYLDMVKQQLTYCSNHRANLRSCLNSIAIEDFNKPDGRLKEESYIKLFQSDDTNIEVIKRTFFEYTDSLEQLKDNVEQFLNDEPSIDEKVEERETKIYWNQQRKIWLTWGQQLIRWTFGAFLIILIYSTGVWLSECYPHFFHMPVYDWIEAVNSQ